MKWALILFILISSCAKPNIDSAFQSYVNQWDGIYTNNKVRVDVQFQDLSAKKFAGQWDGVQISVDIAVWASLNESGRQQVLFHEFGHAMFGYGHDFYCISAIDVSVSKCLMTDNVYAYIPRSIMYPWVFGDLSPYSDNNGYYVEQLKNCSTCTDHTNGNGKNRRQVIGNFKID